MLRKNQFLHPRLNQPANNLIPAWNKISPFLILMPNGWNNPAAILFHSTELRIHRLCHRLSRHPHPKSKDRHSSHLENQYHLPAICSPMGSLWVDCIHRSGKHRVVTPYHLGGDPFVPLAGPTLGEIFKFNRLGKFFPIFRVAKWQDQVGYFRV